MGIVQGATPVLFDHDADGVRTGTGWLQGDDAWLVLDRNGNGRVDSGRELFGVDTLISGTAGTISAVYARNGFEVLRTLLTCRELALRPVHAERRKSLS